MRFSKKGKLSRERAKDAYIFSTLSALLKESSYHLERHQHGDHQKQVLLVVVAAVVVQSEKLADRRKRDSNT